DAVVAADEIAESGNRVVPGLAAVLKKRAVRVAVPEGIDKAVMTEDPGHGDAGIPVAYPIAHAEAELIGVRCFEMVVDHVDFLACRGGRYQRLQVGESVQIGRIPGYA